MANIVHFTLRSTYDSNRFINVCLQAKNSSLAVTDEEGLQHVMQELEAKIAAPLVSDRFKSFSQPYSLL